MGPGIRRIESLVPRRAPAFGGKARGLAALARAGFPVPAAFAVSSEVCDAFLREALAEQDLPVALLNAAPHEVGPERLAEIQARVRDTRLPRALIEDLHLAWDELRAEGATAIAVRSSSLREDEEARSAAGLHDTVLAVADERQLEDAVRAAWASFFEPRVIQYLRTMSVQDAVGLGLVLQTMVPAECSGVLFTINPLTFEPAEMVLNASYGLGKPIVDGSVSPDTYRIDKASGWVRDRIVGEKHEALRWTAEGGLRREPVSPQDAAREALSPATIDALLDLGLRIEAHFGGPRDIEFSTVGSAIYVLQARPVTAMVGLTKPAPKARARVDRSSIVWSNVNVGEALPGVATPLTWSVLSNFSERGFRNAFASLGCSVPKDAELVGNFRGRIYLNMSEFMAICSQVPGLRPRTILSLGGGGEIDRLELEVEQRGRAAFLARLPFTAARFASENLRTAERVRRFEEFFAEESARLEGFDFRVLSASALARLLREVERLLEPTGEIMLSVYGSLLASVIALRTLVGLLTTKERAELLVRDLLAGLADVDSAAPGLALMHVAEIVRGDLRARDHVRDTPAEELTLEGMPAGPGQRAMADFFAAYGDRGAREAEIAEPRWREDPTLPFATLRLHLEGTALTLEAVERRQSELRERAQKQLEAAAPLPLRPAIRRLLELVRNFLRLRESLRSNVVTVLGFYRAVALDASRRISAMEPGAGEGAAFFLQLPELHAVLRGEVSSVAPLIRSRRLQYTRDCALPPPPDTFVGLPPPLAASSDDSVLRGLAASGGHAVGLARVMSNPSDAAKLEAGEILVAREADVGWSPLFLVAAAIVTDLGGPLSHASIVAREYGVPAVVNLKQGTRVIRTGDRIEVDGDAGTVRILERAITRAEP